MLRLPSRLHRALIAAAADRPDIEVCGLLAGRAGAPEELLPVTNARHRPDTFDMDPAELIAAMRRLRETGRELVAIYHSHPTGPPWPSPTDLAENHYPEAVHLIIGREGGQWQVRAFRLAGEATELALAIDPGRP